MVNEGYVSGTLDWEFSGWYPEYWEFSKALYVWKWQNDWTEYLVQIREPYYTEYGGPFVLDRNTMVIMGLSHAHHHSDTVGATCLANDSAA
jgi:hypothetical protein